MKLGIMQPYFFPYIGHYALIAATDRWVVFDSVQYAPRSWMNRNRVLHPRTGWQWVGVPVNRAPRGTPIHRVTVLDKQAALTRIVGQLDHYRRCAPFHAHVVELVRAAFAAAKTDGLADVATASLTETCRFLDIRMDWTPSSALSVAPESIRHAGDWALEISRTLGASLYVNPPGGRSLFRPEDWRAAGIGIGFLETSPFRYPCGRLEFVENLSILDVLMWNDAASVRAAVCRARVVP